MIDIEYKRKEHSVTVKGHAHSGEVGHDLICAAVSAHVYTLAANVSNMAKDKRNIRRPVIDIKEGEATVACSPIHGMSAITELIFDTICVGFELLAQQYPKNINYEVR